MTLTLQEKNEMNLFEEKWANDKAEKAEKSLKVSCCVFRENEDVLSEEKNVLSFDAKTSFRQFHGNFGKSRAPNPKETRF